MINPNYSKVNGKSAIYKIICTPLDKIYIGSSKNLYSRCIQHKSKLNKKKHENIELQKAWNKYGSNNFVFQIIEFVEPEELHKTEEYYIEKTRCCETGFNISKTAQNDILLCKPPQEYIVKDPSGKVYNVFNLRRFCRKHHLDWSAMSKVANGKLISCKGWVCRHRSDSVENWLERQNKRKERLDNRWDGQWKFYHKDGTTRIVDYIYDFCKQNNMEPSAIYRLVKNQVKSSYGFTKIERVEGSDSRNNSW